MVVGQFKIGAIIQARMGSKRLPNKVLLPLPVAGEKTIIRHIIESLTRVDAIHDIVVATSYDHNNDDLANYIQLMSIACYRGSEVDVLSRFYDVVVNERFDFVIRITGDNPIIDSRLLEDFIDEFLRGDLDYLASKNLPVGCNFEMMRSEEIVNAHQNAIDAFDKEHVTPYIKRNAKKQGEYFFQGIIFDDKLRLTIDYPSDYAFLNIIFAELGDEQVTLNRVLEIVEDNKWLLSINSNNYQKIHYSSLSEEIQSILPLLKSREMFHLIDYLSNVSE